MWVVRRGSPDKAGVNGPSRRRDFSRTTVIDIKFDEKTKSELRIGLPCKGKPENAGNGRKMIKLLVEKNYVENYLVLQ